MADYPNNIFLNWAMDWLIFKKKAKNQKEIALRIDYDSMTQAKNHDRNFPDEKLTELIEKYSLKEYYDRYRASPTINPFDTANTISNTHQQKGHSLIDRVVFLETELAKHTDMLNTIYARLLPAPSEEDPKQTKI